MADCSTVICQSEISALKEALVAQQKLLQQLYNELEAEREASATAASEALSVILRLQGEKAAVKMEAEQYKRLAEEKMCHAEESFAIIEDIITQKEMEMAALDYQVQTYKYQLMSMGVVDPSAVEMNIPENLLQRNDFFAGEASLHHLARRNSAPLLVKYKKAMLERENSSASPEMDFISKTVDEHTGQEINDVASDSERKADCSTHGGINSYMEQIRELELRVKDIAGANYSSFRIETRSPSLSSRPSAANLCSLSNAANLQHETRPPSPQLSIVNPNDPSKVTVVNEIDQTKHPVNLRKKGEAVYYPCSSSVHDVFEVPQVGPDSRSYESSSKDREKTASQASEVIESNDRAHPEAVKLYSKDEPDWLKKLLQSYHHEKNSCKPSDIATIDRADVQPTTSVSESRSSLNKLNRSSEITEVERLAESAAREEELKLLKEIKEKLNVLHDEIRCQNVKKSSLREKPSLSPLPEVLLSFWL